MKQLSLFTLAVLSSMVLACGSAEEAVDPGSVAMAPETSVAVIPWMSFDECRTAGGRLRLDPGDGSVRGCELGEILIGRLRGAIEGGYCCK